MLAARLMQRSHGLAVLGARRAALGPTRQLLPALGFATSQPRKRYWLLTCPNFYMILSGDHVKMWTAEKVVSGAQVPAIILPFMWTTPLSDAVFCTLAVLHSHWGIEAIVVDYIRPVLFGGSTTIPNICVA
jgi:hypothetical protein